MEKEQEKQEQENGVLNLSTKFSVEIRLAIANCLWWNSCQQEVRAIIASDSSVRISSTSRSLSDREKKRGRQRKLGLWGKIILYKLLTIICCRIDA